MSILTKIKTFFKKKEQLSQGGGGKAIEKQKQQGKLTARERIDALLDRDSFFETDLFVEHDCKDFGMDAKQLAGDGVVTGVGRIHGRPVGVFAQDFTVAGGSLGLRHARKITKIMELAIDMRMPLIGINDSGGARIQEGVDSLAGYGEIFYRNTLASGVIPQISVILGPCAGGAVYSPALTDFVFMVDQISKMFITGPEIFEGGIANMNYSISNNAEYGEYVTGPEVIKAVLGENVSMEELGGARTHAELTGNAHFIAKNEIECFETIRSLMRFLPQSYEAKTPSVATVPPLAELDIERVIPPEPNKPYDVRDVIRAIVDGSEFLEVHRDFAPNAVIGFARIEGRSIGLVANQPAVLAGVLDCDSSDKISRFIRFCDAFNIPLVTFVDLPGYLPGVDQEHAGVIRHGAKVLYAYSEATVPKLTVILRKAYGGGYIAMCSRHLNADFVIAWPTAEIAVMGPEGAANIIFKSEIAASKNPEKTRQEKIAEYKEKFSNPYVAASRGYIDAVIEPSETRARLAQALELSRAKVMKDIKRKHGIIPV